MTLLSQCGLRCPSVIHHPLVKNEKVKTQYVQAQRTEVDSVWSDLKERFIRTRGASRRWRPKLKRDSIQNAGHNVNAAISRCISTVFLGVSRMPSITHGSNVGTFSSTCIIQHGVMMMKQYITFVCSTCKNKFKLSMSGGPSYAARCDHHQYVKWPCWANVASVVRPWFTTPALKVENKQKNEKVQNLILWGFADIIRCRLSLWIWFW